MVYRIFTVCFRTRKKEVIRMRGEVTLKMVRGGKKCIKMVYAWAKLETIGLIESTFDFLLYE